MSEPLHHLPPSEREAWVEAQVWRRCMASRRGPAGGDGVAGAAPGGASLQALVAQSRELGAGAAGTERPADEVRLLEIARQVELLTSLPPRRAPAALDAVLGLLEELEGDPLADGEEAIRYGGFANDEDAELEALPQVPEDQSPEEIAAFEREDGRLSEWMRSLPAAVPPAELDAHFEAELARHVRALPATEAVAPVVSGPAPRSLSALPGIGGGVGEPSRLHLAWNRRWVAMAAAALLLGVIGAAVLYRGLRFGGAGAVDAPATSSRFSFHYVDVETAGADLAQRPALRLLRGWASHIAPEELERSSSGK
jgi:hypothetical protein